jgi:hypothetical protein
MALRIRKSFKIAPGLRVNVSKSGVSTSIGGKGVTANFSKRGTKLTTSLPGTGFSSSKMYKSSGSSPATKTPLWAHVVTWAIMALVLWLIFK